MAYTVGTPLWIGAKHNLSAEHACFDVVRIRTAKQHENTRDQPSGSQHHLRLHLFQDARNWAVSGHRSRDLTRAPEVDLDPLHPTIRYPPDRCLTPDRFERGEFGAR